MVEAIETRPGLDPDRASFTTALHATQEQLITAQGIDPTGNDTTNGGQLGAIGHAVLATLLPPRRLRYSNRNVKCTTSRYHARDDGRPTHSTDIIAIDITVLARDIGVWQVSRFHLTNTPVWVQAANIKCSRPAVWVIADVGHCCRMVRTLQAPRLLLSGFLTDTKPFLNRIVLGAGAGDPSCLTWCSGATSDDVAAHGVYTS